MDILNKIILLMSKEEQRNYKLISARSHHSPDRKDVQLFDYIRKSGTRFNERKILKRLYGNKGKNVYYRLKNRLQRDVSRSIAFLNFEQNDTLLAHYNLMLAILYREKQAYEIAHHFLKKARSRAEELEHFELLDLIFGEFIRLSFEIPSINPEGFIQSRRENLKMINRLREIDNILAVVTYRIKVTQNYSAADTTILDMLQGTLRESEAEEDLKQSPHFRLRIYEAVSKLLLQQRDYQALEEFLVSTYDEFLSEGLFNQKSHYTKLEMLTYLVNTLLRNEDFDRVLHYAEELKSAMMEFNQMHFDRFLFFYYNALALTYLNTDLDKAVILLQEMLENEKINKVPAYEVYIYQNLALAWYQKRDYSRSLKSMVSLQLSEGFADTDEALKFQIAIFELMVRFDQKVFDTLEYRINQFRQDFRELLNSGDYRSESDFVDLLSEMLKCADIKNDEKIIGLIDEFCSGYRSRDAHFVNFANWLNGKLGRSVQGS